MNRRNNVVMGAIFVILGVLFLLNNLKIFNMHYSIFNIGYVISRFWPFLFLIIPGLAFHYAFFTGRKKEAGLLVPGGILLGIGITFQINMIFGWWNVLWPAYIMAVAVGLFELYVFGNREKGLLVPVGILGSLSIIFFAKELFSFSAGKLLIPVIFIAIGLSIIFGGRLDKKDF